MAPRTISRSAARRAVVLVSVIAVLAGCGSSSGGSNVALVAYSTPQSAYAALIPAFQATADGKGVAFTQSYGASGDQSRNVLAGQPANVVNFSLEPDVTKLVQAGLVSSAWNAGPTHGFVTNSVVVFIVRKGNPKHITTWDDLVKPGVKVITPNPLSSGSARWNIMAAYGAQLHEGKTPAQAVAYLTALLKNTVAQPTSARDALQTFLSGAGDVLLDYESEAIPDEKKGDPIAYVIPSDTLLIQNPIAIVTRGGANAHAQAFVELPAQHRRPADLGAEGLPARHPIACQPAEVPDAARTVHDRVARRLAVGDQAVLPHSERDRRQDRAGIGGLHWLATASSSARPAPRAGPGAGAAGAGRRSPACSGAARSSAYLSIVVLLPIAALAAHALDGGLSGLWQAITAPEGVAALEFTLVVSAIVVVINVVFGTLIAWVLVRDDFPGRRAVNALIDLPFALPTIVVSVVLLALYGHGSPIGIDIALTRAAVAVALLFVTLPFVVRSVQPVLHRARSLDGGGGRLARRLAGDDHPARRAPGARAGDHLRCGAQLRAGGRRVRLGAPVRGAAGVQDRDLLGLHLQPVRERQPERGRGGVDAAAPDLADRARGVRTC